MQTLETILTKILPIPNSQGEEKNLADAILHLIDEIPFPEISEVDFDPNWGLHFIIPSKNRPVSKNGVLFLGHMDSNHHNPKFTIENGKTHASSEIGLDNKAGLSSILYALHRLKRDSLSFPYDIHVYFSVMEEVGQKGAMYFPLEKIKGKVRYGISVDRKTGAGRGGVRHFVNSYRGVPMLIPGDSTFIEDTLGCRGEVSPNCADIIEIRGRYDAELIYPKFSSESDPLREEYKTWTDKIKSIIEDPVNPLPKNRAVSSMNQTPKKDLYYVMGNIYRELYEKERVIPEEYKLSVLNLSIDFQDPYISLKEIDDTSAILIKFLKKHSEGV